MSGLIAIVGRPNVGKSALFNRIVGRRLAIVHDEPGVTRDRIAAPAEWLGRPFTLVDTGGIGLARGEKAGDIIARAALEQVELAIESADAIILVVNVQEGVVPLDREVAQRLRRAGKPVLVAANKSDHETAAQGADEFAALGFDRIFPVSAIHQRGIDALLTAALALLPPAAAPETAAEPAPKLAIVGRPNVGKSSLVNALAASRRVIVSPIPGTTRDSVDIPFEVQAEGGPRRYILIDTAGVRATRRVGDSIEFFSVKRAEDSIERCDIAIFVLDAEAGVTAQDKKVADRITTARKPCVLVVNKWDLFIEGVREGRKTLRAREKRSQREGQAREPSTLAEFAEWIQGELFFLDYAPVIFTSARTGFQLPRLLESIHHIEGQLRQKIPTAILNRALRDAIERRQPVSSAGHRLKFFYATQVKQAPPTFLLFVNRKDLFSDAYRKYLSNEMRRAFGYEGCPINLLPREREKTIAPIRGHRKESPKHPPHRVAHQDRNRKKHLRRSR